MKHKPGEQGEKQPARTILYDLLTQIRMMIAWDVSTPINRTYVIDSKIILQVDATVIVGAFIFLTLSNIIGLTTIIPNKSQNMTQIQNVLTNFEGLLKIGLTTTIVIPFALSAIFVMTASIHAGYGPRLIWWGKFWMIIGFIYIIVGMVLLAILSFYLLLYSFPQSVRPHFLGF